MATGRIDRGRTIRQSGRFSQRIGRHQTSISETFRDRLETGGCSAIHRSGSRPTATDVSSNFGSTGETIVRVGAFAGAQDEHFSCYSGGSAQQTGIEEEKQQSEFRSADDVEFPKEIVRRRHFQVRPLHDAIE